MKKSEMEDHHDACLALEGRIHTMSNSRHFPAVFSVCVESFPTLFRNQVPKTAGHLARNAELLAFGIIGKYAPPLFAHSFIEELLGFVKSTRLLAKHENDYLQAAEAALQREEIARVVWRHVEQQPGTLQRDINKTLEIDHHVAVEIVETWEQLGVITRQQEANSYRLYLRTRLDAEVEGVCPSCGVHGKGRKELFFKPGPCKRCGSEGHYHIRYVDLK